MAHPYKEYTQAKVSREKAGKLAGYAKGGRAKHTKVVVNVHPRGAEQGPPPLPPVPPTGPAAGPPPMGVPPVRPPGAPGGPFAKGGKVKGMYTGGGDSGVGRLEKARKTYGKD